MPGLSITAEATAGNVHQKTGPAQTQPRPFSQMFHTAFPREIRFKGNATTSKKWPASKLFRHCAFYEGKNDPVQHLIVAMNEFSFIRLSTLNSEVGRWGRAIGCLYLYFIICVFLFVFCSNNREVRKRTQVKVCIQTRVVVFLLVFKVIFVLGSGERARYKRKYRSRSACNLCLKGQPRNPNTWLCVNSKKTKV